MEATPGNYHPDSFTWHCPRCKAPLSNQGDQLHCSPCQQLFERVGNIPDLRLTGASWIDLDKDREQARKLLEIASDMSLQELVEHVYRSQPGRDEHGIQLRTRQLMEAPRQKQRDFQGWLKPYATDSGLLMDLGCGGGTLIAGASLSGYQGIGIDVSMTWLVVAQKMITEAGGEPLLAGAMAESLPLPDGSISGAISFDVIEHVDDPAYFLAEINRVVAPGGKVLLTTPNRFSLTAEPHVFVWGVGWLPRKLQQPYVTWRNGMDYRFTKLMSSMKLSRLLTANTDFNFTIHPGAVPDSEIAHFSRSKKRLAILYNRIQTLPLIRTLFMLVGPFFYVDAKKN